MKTKIFIALLAVATLLSCNSTKQNKHQGEEHEEHGPEGVVVLNEQQQKALNLKLGNFQMRNLTSVVKTNGQLEVPPANSADITAVIGGNVKQIRVFHGDKVKEGQLLAVLEHPDYIVLQENFSEIANRLEYLEKEYERQKELFENKIGAGKVYQQAKAEYKTAKAKYEGLKSRLQLLHLSPEKVIEGKISNTVNILSPINGYVNEVNIKVGTYVDARDKLFAITDNSTIHADFMVYEKDVHLVKEGQKVHFTVSNRPEKEYTGYVFAIGKEFEANSRAVHIHAKINEQVSGLIPGMYISGHLHADEKYTRALPKEAIVTEGTKSYIFIYDEIALSKQHEHTTHGDDEIKNEHGGHDNEDAHSKAFRMVEVIPGQKDDGYTEIHLIDSLPENVQIVMNAAYYLLADMKKEETEHEH
ncbi:efflux RND transporter periplasmic adaptor subunit [Marinifilum sp.]|uniref:efflux RND transporter periplasmic adaptor subunit n=1 Tax=Marinifilum sp. TaxID=2033137 RepID=UPI003BA8834F